MDNVKICRECKFFHREDGKHFCARIAATVPDLVLGGTKYVGLYNCEKERSQSVYTNSRYYDSYCGIEGSYFKPVEQQ